MGPLQPDSQLPAFARLHLAHLLHRIAKARVPRQRDAGRDLDARIVHAFDREVKARALVELVRQVVDGTGEGDVAAFVAAGKLWRQRQRGQQRRPAKAQHRARHCCASDIPQAGQQHGRAGNPDQGRNIRQRGR